MASRPLPAHREGLPTPPDPLGGTPDLYQAFWRASQPTRRAFRPRLAYRGTLPTLRGLPTIREGLSTPPGPPGVPPNPSWHSGSTSRPLPPILQGLPTATCPPGGSSEPYQPTGRTSRPLPFLWEGLPTPPVPPGGPLDPPGGSTGPLKGPPDPFCLSERYSRPSDKDS